MPRLIHGSWCGGHLAIPPLASDLFKDTHELRECPIVGAFTIDHVEVEANLKVPHRENCVILLVVESHKAKGELGGGSYMVTQVARAAPTIQGSFVLVDLFNGGIDAP